MIRYALRCPAGHGFESWFRSASDYETLRAGGHVHCPECGHPGIEKAPMAPGVMTRTTAAPAAAPAPDADVPPTRAEVLRDLRHRIESQSEYVGLRFATEARRMHSGESPDRAIHGEARPEEARALLEEGVPILPLPFIPSRKAN